MSFFEKLYEGAYAPIQDETPDTAEFKEQWEIMSNAEDELRKTLTKEQLELFEKHQQAQVEIESMLHVQAFKQGFCVGVEFQKEFRKNDYLQEKSK